MCELGAGNRWVQLAAAMAFMSAAGVATAHDYACHVQIVKDKPAIVLVDTDSDANARRAAAGAEAKAADGTRGPVVRVVECIDRLNGRFSDRQIQQQLERLAL
jgi:hypothetical protein